MASLWLCAEAQYTVTLKDNTRMTIDSPQLTFEGSGADAQLVIGDQSIALSEVAHLEAADPEAAKPMVIAYHPYYSPKLPDPKIVTHICYSFAEVYVENGVYKGFKLQGNQSAFNRCMALKAKNPELKILLSFTHTVVNEDNKQDGGFSAIAASAEYRQQFAEDCVAYMGANNLDGIDMDWEFPGLSWSGAACDPLHDVDNYTLLIKQMRETFGSDYLLSFAGYCMNKRSSNGGWRYIDLAAVEPYVDFINVMTYDLDESPNFHNAIKSARSYWDIERTMTAYTNAGVPMDKIVMGIPFYIRNTFSNSHPWSKLSNLKESEGYKTDNWDATAQVPYVTLNGKMWGSYDNERSIAGKARYAARKGLRGLFYWCTYEDDTRRTLSHATWDSAMLYMR